MRPIKLQFAGINSYRSIQVIDFEQLGREGLFGIFGPTGSGKSSILDAISLALYGGVDRASNNTRGIIHQLEKALNVSFQFELGDCRYLVERRYERNAKDPDSAVAKQARLRRINPDGPEEVLASKPQEVTGMIEEILGIRREEFARAVVLPQGKFDQFLRLSGGERAAMLEHLFNLGQFGETLVIKVKKEAGVCAQQLQRIEGEEQGLGDCSAEAVAQAEVELKKKSDECQKAQEVFDEADKAYKEAEALSELATKRKAILARKSELERNRPAMERQQNRLHLADCAEPLRELIYRQKELTEKIAAELQMFEGKSGRHKEAKEQYSAMKAALEQAEGAYNDQYPKLQEQKAAYKSGLEKQQKYLDLQKTRQQKTQEHAEIRQVVAGIEAEINNYQEELVNTRTAMENLQQNRTQLMVSSEEKELIDKGLDVLRRLEESEQRFKEKEQSYCHRKAKQDGQWIKLVAEIHKLLPERDVAPGDKIGVWAKKYLASVEQELNDARETLQDALIKNSAAELVKELRAGEPCPVCGAREHPQPAQATDEADNLQAIIKNAEQKLREARNWEEQLRKALQDWENSAIFLREAQEELDRAKREQEVHQADFELVRGALDREGLRKRKEALAGAERQLQRFDREREVLLTNQEALTEQLANQKELLQTKKLQEVTVQGELKNISQQMEDVSLELEQIAAGQDLRVLIQKVEEAIQRLRQGVEVAKKNEAETRDAVELLAKELTALEATLANNRKELTGVEGRLAAGLTEVEFTDAAQAEGVLLSSTERQTMRRELEEYRKALAILQEDAAKIDREIAGRSFDEASFELLKTERQELLVATEQLKADLALAKNKVEQLRAKQTRWNELQQQKAAAEQRKALADEVGSLLRGRKFVSFLAQEHLRDMALEASYQLGRLSSQRFALELAKDKDCEFVIRDDYHGGNRRTVHSLSGGEIFMTSLALALALSSKIQLRGRYPLGFFFLDEGFGTLDEEKLDKVMNALEKLHDKNRMVGIISHVRELKERLPRYLEVAPAGEDGSGSQLQAH